MSERAGLQPNAGQGGGVRQATRGGSPLSPPVSDDRTELDRLRAQVHALEQLLEVHEQTVADQSSRLEETLRELDARARELERSNKELETFAYIASHDLQEPLRMIASYTQLLEHRYGAQLDDTAREFIGFAVDGANRMQALIQALLQYSRVETKGAPFTKVPLVEVMDAVRRDLQLVIEEKGARVTNDPLPVVHADRAQMNQLVQNLVGNALKFSRASAPEVHVSAREDGDRWVLSVRDNGIGIDKRYHERIFQIFQRLHGPADFPGTGIGLAVCRRIVERHGGSIWVESASGAGSTFLFTLPRRKTRE